MTTIKDVGNQVFVIGFVARLNAPDAREYRRLYAEFERRVEGIAEHIRNEHGLTSGFEAANLSSDTVLGKDARNALRNLRRWWKRNCPQDPRVVGRRSP